MNRPASFARYRRPLLFLLFVALFATAAPALARADQPAPPAAPGAGAAPPPEGAGPEGPAAHAFDKSEGELVGALGNSREAALFFWLVAFGTVAGSIFVITRRNLIAAVMGMVGTFFAIAVLYAMLYAHFLAVIQVLVYAGAIMVLFVFVVMILNREEEQPWAIEGLFGKAIAGGALLYLLFRLGQVLWTVKDLHAVGSPGLLPGLADHSAPADWGSMRALGTVLFSSHLFAFEAVSLVLLVAVVGAIAVARPGVTEPNRSPQKGAPQRPLGTGTRPQVTVPGAAHAEVDDE